MCPHDKFDYFEFSEIISKHPDGTATAKVLRVRVCQQCHEPDILTDQGWRMMIGAADPCQVPHDPR